MRMMLQYTPGRRITFVGALRSWYPDSPVLASESKPEAIQSEDQVLPQELVSQCPEPQAYKVEGRTPESPVACHTETRTPATEPPRTEAQTAATTTETEPEKSSLGQPAESYPVAHPPHQLSGSAVSASVSVVGPPSLPSATLVRSRLVLKRSVYSAERNKTRRNPRN